MVIETVPIDRDIDLPVSQPTMPAFAGEDLATLYVTSASDQMSAEAKASEPQEDCFASTRRPAASRGPFWCADHWYAAPMAAKAVRAPPVRLEF
jgi:sugar lactone lactonase YvrE